MDIAIDPDVPKVRRKTDSILDWLGDWGGLLDCLNFLVDLLINPYAAFVMNSQLSYLLVKFFSADPPQYYRDKRQVFMDRFFKHN